MAKNDKTTTNEEPMAKASEAPEPKAPEDQPVDDGLVSMQKSGEVLRVHPTTVEAHKQAGWSHK